MIRKGTLLVAILPDLEHEDLRQYILNSASFANQIDANIHFLAPPDTQSILNLTLKEIPAVNQTLQTVFHPIIGDWSSDVVNDAVEHYSCDLVVVPLGVPIGSITKNRAARILIRNELFEKIQSPILILSPKIELPKTPIGSVLIPMSGEICVSSALNFGLRLASRIHVPVDLVHVIQGEFQTESFTKSSLDTLGDQPHHEYRQLLERILAEASPFSDPKERAQVRSLYQVQGLPSVEILKAAKNTPSCALVAEWHGSLIHGKAEVLKDLLHEIVIPIFLIKTESEETSILRIGPESRVA